MQVSEQLYMDSTMDLIGELDKVFLDVLLGIKMVRVVGQ
jgi:hypothetical protein